MHYSTAIRWKDNSFITDLISSFSLLCQSWEKTLRGSSCLPETAQDAILEQFYRGRRSNNHTPSAIKLFLKYRSSLLELEPFLKSAYESLLKSIGI